MIQSGLSPAHLDSKVINRMNSRFTNKVLLALEIGSVKLAREAYDRTQSIPQTNTCQQLATKSIFIYKNDFRNNGNENLEICFVDGR